MSSTLRAASDAIPRCLKLPLFIFLNIALDAAFSYLESPWVTERLRAVQRPMTTLNDYTGLVGWRIIELCWHWAGGWDATQGASFVMLSLAPSIHYMHTFQPTHFPLFPTLAAIAVKDLLSLYLPLLFLRPSPPDPKPIPARKKNRGFNPKRLFTTTLLTSGIYLLVLYSISVEFLVGWLIRSVWELESVVHVNDVHVLMERAVMMTFIGWAASVIISYPPNDASDSAVTQATEKKERPEDGVSVYPFRQRTSSLSQQSRVIVKRTLLVVVYQGLHITISLAGTVKGGDFMGAVGISGVWAVATVIVGGVLWLVGKIFGE